MASEADANKTREQSGLSFNDSQFSFRDEQNGDTRLLLLDVVSHINLSKETVVLSHLDAMRKSVGPTRHHN